MLVYRLRGFYRERVVFELTPSPAVRTRPTDWRDLAVPTFWLMAILTRRRPLDGPDIRW